MTRQRIEAVGTDPALAALAAAGRDRPLALLHSGRSHARWARRSLLAQPVATYRYTSNRGGELTGLDRPLAGRLFDDLRALLNDPQLPGRWFGYIAYEVAHLIEPAKLGPPPPPPEGDWPLVELGYCPDWQELPATTQAAPERSEDADPTTADVQPNFTRAAYEAAVQRAIDYIAAGDVFQVNLAQRFTGKYIGDPRQLYQRLAEVSPAWYGAYLEVGSDKWEVKSSQAPPCEQRELGGGPTRALLSTSPELFLEVAAGRVVTRPIKGTRPNDGRSTAADELQASPKDAAELNMIVDLMRNDLGRVCEYGSVRVTQPRIIETHPTVHHGVATVEGQLHPSRDIVDLLKATLPGGSITGAPKVRAMQIIGELEPDPRGPYCGCIGWLSRDACQLNIAIRTMLLTQAEAQRSAQAEAQRSAASGPHPAHPTYDVAFSVGGGVVADSNPADEYDETLTKARAMLAALGGER